MFSLSLRILGSAGTSISCVFYNMLSCYNSRLSRPGGQLSFLGITQVPTSLTPAPLAHFLCMNQRAVCCSVHLLSHFLLIFSYAVLMSQVAPYASYFFLQNPSRDHKGQCPGAGEVRQPKETLRAQMGRTSHVKSSTQDFCPQSLSTHSQQQQNLWNSSQKHPESPCFPFIWK